MSSEWITFVKGWSAKHNVTYGCALSNPQCSADYRKEKSGKGLGSSKVFTKDEMTIIRNKNKEKKKKTEVMKFFEDSEAGRLGSLEYYDRLKKLSTEQQNAYRELQMTELNKLKIKTKGKGVGRSKVKVVDEFTDVTSGEIKPKPKTKGKRKVIDIMTAPVVSNRAREIQIQDKNKTRTSRIYVEPN